MRTLALTPERFACLYQAILAGDFAGIEARLAVRTMTKLEDAGEFDKDTNLYGLKVSAIVNLDEGEFALVRRCVEQTRWKGHFLKTAIEVMDWLETVSEHKTP